MRNVLVLSILCLAASCRTASKLNTNVHSNSLIHEASPYLRQHAHNPVDWMPWSEAAFEKAQREEKPVFLSVGYSACHWCHVMERESFEDDSIAEYLNQNFVSIKVDREERPDVDHHYMQAVQAMSGHGGWPMSVFLTPDKKPFYAGTYWPPRSTMGRPGFTNVIESVARAWQINRDEILSSADEIHAALQGSLQLQNTAGELSPALLGRAVQSSAERYDPISGGFGSAPKFPHAMELALLLRVAARTSDERGRNMALHTLKKMAAGGIYDHLGGGFHRYSTDSQWRVPHFEKMLYDNALLVPVYLDAWLLTGQDEFSQVARETVDWALREMELDGGGFASSLDADSEGKEGIFYSWNPTQVRQVLDPVLANLFCRIYDVSDTGNFEHGLSVLNLPVSLDESATRLDVHREQLEYDLKRAKSLLFQDREKRVRPSRDDKILADWNGLMLTALARGYAATNDESYLNAAQRTANRILGYFERTEKLPHSMLGNRVQETQLLLDYAAFGTGLLELFMCDGNQRWLDGSIQLARSLDSLFASSGSFYRLSEDNIAGAESFDPYDSSLPSGIALAGNLHARLFYLTGDVWYRDRAKHQVQALAGQIERAAGAFSQSLVSIDLLLNPPPQVVIVGDQDRELWRIAQKHRLPECLIAWIPDSYTTERAMPGALAALIDGKTAIDGHPTAYVCRDFTCGLPATSAVELHRQLSQQAAATPIP